MTKTYLGETVVDASETPYAEYTPSDWAMYFIERYGQIDGDHHKAWVLDQVARILKGTPVIIKMASWSDGKTEYRVSTQDDVSEAYATWVMHMKGDLDPDWGYEEGCAP